VTVIELVARERARMGRVVAIRGGAIAAAAVAVVLAVGALALGGGRWMALPAVLPFLAWGVAALALAGLAWLTLRQLRRDTATARIATAIEHERRLRSGSLRGALEVGETGVLGRRGARAIATRLVTGQTGRSSLVPALRRGAVRRAAAASGVAVIAAATLGAAAIAAPDGWSAVVHPVRAWHGTLLPALHIEAPADVPRGREARIRITAPGRQRIAVYMRATGSGWSGGWYPATGGAVRLTTAPVAGEVAIVATDGRSVSDTAIIRASDRPFVGGVALRAVYPGYLHRNDEALPPGEVARVPRGTRIDIAGRASTTLGGVALVRGADTARMQPDGRQFSGHLVAETPGAWSWLATSVTGPIADLPDPLQVDVIPDSAPHVEILSPGRDTIVTPGDRIPLSISASDDHALASVVLRTWRTTATGAVMPDVFQVITDSAAPQWTGVSVLDLAARTLQPGDALRIVARATDGSPWHQSTESRVLVLHVPSLSDQRVLARETADSALANATATITAERDLQRRTEEAARARGARTGSSSGAASGSASRSSLSYESAERAKALAKEQRDLAARVDQLQHQAQQMERQLKQAGALDSGLASRLHEAQQLLRDALTPEMRDQLSRLDQSADSLRGGDTRQSLADLAQQQQRLRDQLDRSLDVLKRAALEGSMQTLRDEARDIAKQERARANGSPPPRETPPAPREMAAKGTADSARARATSGQPDSAGSGPRGQTRDPSQQQTAANPPSSESQTAATQQTPQQQAPQQQAAPQQASQQASQQTAPPSGQQSHQQSPQQAAQLSSPQSQQQSQQQEAQESAQPQQSAGHQSQDQLAERSRSLSRDIDDLAKRLSSDKAQTGAQRVGAARDHVDTSAQAMAGRDASKASSQMDQAAQGLSDARQAQISEWKSALTSELDRTIQETLQLGRQENELAQRAQQGEDKAGLQAQQSAVEQGTQRASERLQRAGQQSALVSGNSQRAVAQARSQVQAATRDAEQTQPGSAGSQQTASSLRGAADALNQAAAALVRDRERASSASSASGLSEMLQEMQQLAKAQGSLNAQAQGLALNPSANPQGSPGSQSAQALAEAQRKLAESLDRAGDDDPSGRADGLATEAHQIADALARSGVDQQTLIRQQRLYHRLLDAGHTLEQDERDSTGKRVAQAATGREQFAPPSGPAQGQAATRFQAPSWSELRGLSADERQLVLEYFKRINAQSP
jgi:hypothetical protein